MDERSRSEVAHTFTDTYNTDLRRTFPTMSIQQHILIGSSDDAKPFNVTCQGAIKWDYRKLFLRLGLVMNG
jgi:hypothetical protein